MPEMEVLPIQINGKQVAKLILLYDQTGWIAQVATKRITRSEVVARGTDKLNHESARALVLDLGGKWRDEEARQRRG